jgi:hypothetical protein
MVVGERHRILRRAGLLCTARYAKKKMESMIRFPLRPRLSGTAEHADFVRQIYGLAETRFTKPVGRAAELDRNTRRADLDMGSKQLKQSADSFCIIGRNVYRRRDILG